MFQVTPDLDYTKTFTKKDNSIVVNEKYKMSSAYIDQDDFKKTRSFFETVKNRFGERVILQKN